ncbi:zf-HC2 domain-containing protein [Promicromonospora sp. MEB111]|uniref:zf-HC2 domain-containing protein n=1 Tax=Promicromonospora sp. MEB111 TaxID=3040301 RepID=UPI00254C15BA|nr:zf-HC2 domain-containing protein [Promicromonospora sp. MEB111]
MTVTSADLGLWAAHRRAVVFTVSRRVPGIDPELATSCGLELLCVELLKARDLADPLAFWSAASIDVAKRMAREQDAAAEGSDDGAADVKPPGHAVDLEVLGLAMERLPAGEQQLLWDHHVGSRPVAAIADEIGVLPYAAKRRLRRAENRLASTFAEAHSGTAADVECRATRAALHDFVRNRLLPRRRQQVEDHMVGCSGCTRAYVDVRESYWMLRAAAPVLLLGAAASAGPGATAAGVVAGASGAAAAAGPAASGAATAGTAAAGAGSWLSTVGTRAVVTARSVLTDPMSLTATVAGGLFVTTAVTIGVVGSIEAAPSFHETGTVSVVAPDGTRPVVRQAARPSPHTDPANVPDLTDVTPTGLVPSARATAADDVPPGLAKQDGVPPGLATKDTVPPAQAKKDDATPPGLAKKDGVPPGQAKKDKVPPGQAKKDDVPLDQAARDTPPGQAKKDTPPDEAEREKKDRKKATPPGQARSRSTSTS